MKKIIFIADIHLLTAVVNHVAASPFSNNQLKEQEQFLNIYPLI
ncbi:hypothetical protein SAMN05421866_4168 [Chryseobacterium oranimense]|uniref:Uncharacterized protein n=1 Tax=Chryseobacterium oranimense TaxID=421058 RepID=A0A1M5WR08_9FLAO|nr:hypothetical protein SAMN05421866_4168 [Chryseobacterium oranimense]